MASNLVRQGDFSGGEIAPNSYGKIESAAYLHGLRTALNLIPTLEGPIVNRPGFRFTDYVQDFSYAPLLVPFTFADGQTFMLEIGDQYIRFIQNGALVLTAPLGGPYQIVSPWRIADVEWLKWSQNGDVITFDCINRGTGTEYPPYELTRISNLSWLFVAASTTPPTFSGALVYVNNPFPNGLLASSAWNAGTTYAKGDRVDFNSIGYVSLQNANTNRQPDVVDDTWWSPHSWSNGVTYKQGDTVWHTIGFDGKSPPLGGADLATLPARANGQLYTSLKDLNFNQQPDTATTYWAASVDASHPAKDWSFVYTRAARDTLGDIAESSASSPTTMRVPAFTDRPVRLLLSNPNYFTTTPALSYSIYAGRNGVYGLIGSQVSTGGVSETFSWDGEAPDFGTQPPRGTDPFLVSTGANATTDSYPRCLTYHEQRLIQAGSMKRPQDFDGSAIGDYHRWDINTPQQDSDAFRFRPASERLEDIRSLLSLRYLLIFTGGGVWGAYGPAGQITPTGINLRRYNNSGSSFLQPLGIDRAALYLTDRHRVLDLNWDWRADMYVSRDVSVIARHFIEGYTITGWCYQQTPYGVIWAVRNDGVLLSITYSPGGIEAWAKHTTPGGIIERVASVTEPLDDTGAFEDAVYVIVKRTVNGAVIRTIERMSSRLIPLQETVDDDGTSTFTEDVRLCNFLDASLEFDGRNTRADLPVNLADIGNGFDAGQVVQIESVAHAFDSVTADMHIVLDPDGDAPIELRVTVVQDSAHLLAEVLDDGASAYTAPSTKWGLAITTVTGLEHLESHDVNVLGDGAVSGPYTVQAGQITLGTPAVIVQVGLGYNSDLELLDVPTATAEMNEMSVRRMFFKVVSSRGLLVGETFDIPQGKTVPRLVAPQLQNVADGNTVPPLYTGIAEVYAPSSWNRGGRACLRQSDPLPLTVTAAVRELVPGSR